MRKTQNGFTLMEILIVIAILGIIGALALPSYNNSVERGKLSECTAFAYRLSAEQEKFFTENLTYTADLTSALGLNLATSDSEKGHCTASVETLPAGRTCEIDDATERCTSYTITVTRNSPDLATMECGILTLTNQGVKGVTSAGAVDDCWR